MSDSTTMQLAAMKAISVPVVAAGDQEDGEGPSYSNRNPARPEQAGAQGRAASDQQIDRALDTAARAFDGWRKVMPAERGTVLYGAAARIESEAEQWAVLLTREEGKT